MLQWSMVEKNKVMVMIMVSNYPESEHYHSFVTLNGWESCRGGQRLPLVNLITFCR